MFSVLGIVAGAMFVQPAGSAQPIAAPFVVEDLRPAKERKKNYMVSSQIFSCDFGVYNISDAGVGDHRAARDRVNGLRTALEAQFAARLNGHVLRVSRYRLLLNGASAAKSESVTGALGGGMLAPMIASGRTVKAKCGRQKMTAGWFDSSELKNDHSPIVIEFEGTFDGHSVQARTVFSPTRELSSGYAVVRTHGPDNQEFAEAYRQTNEQIAEQVKRLLD